MTESYKNYTIEIEQDNHDESPRDWDNLATMYYRHRDYILGDETIPDHFYNDNGEYIEIVDAQSFIEWRKSEGDDIAVMLPLAIYDHSGVTIWAGSKWSGTDAQWDCSDVGWIVVTKKQIIENWNIKRVTAKYLKLAEEMARSEVKTFAQYLEGDVWVWSVTDAQGEYIDSCGGFYGYDYAIEEAQGSIDYDIELKRKQRIEQVKKYIKSGAPLNYRFTS